MSTTYYRVVRDTRNPCLEFALEDGSRPVSLTKGMLVRHDPLSEPTDGPPAAERLARVVFDPLSPQDVGQGFLENLTPQRPPLKWVTLSPGSWSTPT